ncbi:FAD-dependent monooxygenase [Nonomuraea sp. NPDC049480]|uniref:FAD-dependent monooxygenase n=1 Tax=Nonomuraea sp. NPDC049480 TaxID=3364353 RepID=UPI0037ACC161
MKNRRILVSGAGVAGPTLAYWLARWGFRPTLVERAPALRTGGYLLDFSGAGFDVAQRMGLVPHLSRLAVRMDETLLVDRDGRVRQRIDMNRTLASSADRYMTIARSDLSQVIYAALGDGVETIFGDTVTRLRQDEDGVEVDFERAGSRRFDLVIGCDGLHSTTRQLVFGDERQFTRPLGFCVAAFVLDDYPHSEKGAVLGHLEPGRQTWVHGLDDGRTAFSMIFAASPPPRFNPRDAATHKALVRRAYADAGWQVPKILDELSRVPDPYFDLVCQTRMSRWHESRVALAGDAVACPSLVSGQGSAFGMAEAYALAGELHAADGDHTRAFPAYESLLKPFITAQQDKVRRATRWIIPKTALGRQLQDTAAQLLSLPLIAKRATGRVADVRLPLPHYPR